MDINDLHQEKGNLVKKMRDINDAAIEAGKDIVGDKLDEYNRMEARVNEIDSVTKRAQEQKELERTQLENHNRMEGGGHKDDDNQQQWSKDESLKAAREKVLAVDVQSASRFGIQMRTDVAISAYVQRATDEYRDAFNVFVRHGKNKVPFEVSNALSIGTDASGGYLAPESWEASIIAKREQYNEIRQYASVIQSASDRHIPLETDRGTSDWTAEANTYNESDPVFGELVLGAHKLTRLVKVSEELMQDSIFPMEPYLANAFGRSHGIAEEAAFVNGDGSGKPSGMVLGAGTGITLASNSAIAADEIIDMFYSVPRPYRAMATWVFNDATVALIRKLKGADNNYLWQMGMQADEPDRLLNRPIIASDGMPVLAASATVGVFGDLSYYIIMDRMGMSMRRLDELYAETGQVGFKLSSRTDGGVALDDAIRALVAPA